MRTTIVSAAAIANQTIELPIPPPMRPSFGSPRRPKIKAQLTMALSGIPAELMTNTQPGRSNADTKFRITWNSIQVGMTHM